MGERRGDPDLAGEPVGAEQRAELGPEHLDRHLAVVLEVVGQVDRGHAAAAELALEGVAAREGGGEDVELGRGHGGILLPEGRADSPPRTSAAGSAATTKA